MPDFEFQYQYQPDDLKAIREANSEIVFSPASNISAAATGFALGLLILGAAGQWLILLAAIFTGLLFLLIMAKRLNARSRGNREYQLRTIQFLDDRLIERTQACQSVKAWSVFEECVETDRHFLLRHYQRITAIPKRVIQESNIAACRDFLIGRIGVGDARFTVPEFEQWFSQPGIESTRFNWHPSDGREILSSRLKKFDPENRNRDATKMRYVVGLIIIVIGLGFLSWPIVRRIAQGGNWIQLLDAFRTPIVCLLAVSAPFMATRFWRKIKNYQSMNQTIRMPEEEVRLGLSADKLMVGYAGAVSRYDVEGISSVYLGLKFVGFQIDTGPISVIPIRAFANVEQARSFLRRLGSNAQKQPEIRDHERATDQ